MGSMAMPGMGNSTSSFIPMPPANGGGSGMNPAGTMGGTNTAAGVPMANAKTSFGNLTPTAPSGVAAGPSGASSTLTGLMGNAGGASTFAPTATGDNGQVVAGGQQTQRQTDRTLGELQNYYGEGIGSYIYSLMQNGGMNMGLLNQVDTSQIAAMQPQINQGQADLNSTLGAQGVSGNSSTSALANSQYLSNAITQENAQISGNYLHEYDQGQQLLQSILGGVLGTNQQGTANDGNWMDTLSSVLGLGGSVASWFGA